MINLGIEPEKLRSLWTLFDPAGVVQPGRATCLVLEPGYLTVNRYFHADGLIWVAVLRTPSDTGKDYMWADILDYKSPVIPVCYWTLLQSLPKTTIDFFSVNPWLHVLRARGLFP